MAHTRARFEKKVQREGVNGCHLWTASRIDGYGHVNIDGHFKRAHRVAWEMAYGPIPAGMCVLHKCDNRACVNLRHLFLGTKKDNIQDAMVKGRVKFRGEANRQSKLTWEDVRSIRELYVPWQWGSAKSLAKKFHTSIPNIYKIISNQRWVEHE